MDTVSISKLNLSDFFFLIREKSCMSFHVRFLEAFTYNVILALTSIKIMEN